MSSRLVDLDTVIDVFLDGALKYSAPLRQVAMDENAGAGRDLTQEAQEALVSDGAFWFSTRTVCKLRPDPVPPFPSEPAFGSPEAVDQAASSISSDLHRQLRREETAELRDPYAAQVRQIPSQADLLAEVERLRGELRGMTIARDASLLFQRDAEEQRDALADALQAVRQRIAIEGPPPQMMALCANGGQRLGAATAWDWLRADLRSMIEAALRKAGRLP